MTVRDKPNRGSGRPSSWFEGLLDSVVKNREPASRSYRYLSRLIERDFAHREGGVALALSSPDDDAASASTLLMLAYCLQSELDARVLIIDGRFKGIELGVSGRLGVAALPGFAELLRETEGEGESDAGGSLAKFVKPTAIAKVEVLPAGDTQRVTLAAWDRRRFAALLRQAKTRYDLVLVQLGPVLADTRNLLVSTQVDAVFLIAIENQTLMKSLADSQSLMHDNGVADVRVIVA